LPLLLRAIDAAIVVITRRRFADGRHAMMLLTT